MTPRSRFELTDRRRELLRRLLAEENPGPDALPRIVAGDDRAPALLSFSQQRLWLFEQMVPGTAVYNLPAGVRIRGPLDHEVLARSLDLVVGRHSALRTTFPSDRGAPRQRVGAHVTLPLSLEDLQHLQPPERVREASRLVQREIEHGFDLERGPLVRTSLLRHSPDDHVLVLNMHHIVGDAWSWDRILAEVAESYAALRRGAAPALPRLEVQYTDYARWQRARFDAGGYERDRRYWLDALAGANLALELPTDRPRPAEPRFDGRVERFELGAPLVEQLRTLSHAEGVSLFTTTCAAFDILLHLYSGEDDIVVATPTANRDIVQIEPLVGFFANTLPLRAVIDRGASVRDLLHDVERSVRGALASQGVPFEKIVEDLQPPRRSDGSPLLQVMFAFRKAHRAGRFADLGYEYEHVHNNTCKRDLTLQLVESDSHLEGHVEFDTSLFGRATIARLIDHYRRLLAQVAQDPSVRIGDMSLLNAAEERDLCRWNTTVVRYSDSDSCIHSLVERQAARTPQAVAVRFGDESLTYDELNRRANQLAHRLIELGVGPETAVGLCLNRSLELMIAVLGVLKAGGAYVPVTPSDPVERLHGILQDARAAVVLASAEAPAASASWAAVRLDRSAGDLDGYPAVNPTSGCVPENAAYILYTSGSTGKPKGVVVEHAQVVNYVHAILERLEIAEPLNYALVQPLTVDSSVTTVFPPLVTGGALEIFARSEALDADILAERFRAHCVDVLKIAPSHLASLERSRRFKDLLPRRRLVVGGEPSPMRWLAEIQTLAPGGCAVHNHYGPTEATVGVLTYAVASGGADDCATAPLGHPLANTEAHVLDPDLRPVPVGVAGELHIAGRNVARGYAGAADLTAASFVPNPFAATPGERLYRTGDLVRRLHDGSIEFLGRRDDQVKIRGRRVELGEIESCLRDHPAVLDVAVVAREDVAGDVRLLAYVVARGELDEAVAVAYLRERLPDHMIPEAFTTLDSLPLSHHGKVDRRRLPAPAPQRSRASSRLQPRTELEAVVADVWKRLLRTSGVGIDDSFFELGGHSLLVVELHRELEQALGKEFRLIDLFRLPTVRTQAALLGEQRDTTALAAGRERGTKQSELRKRPRTRRRA